MSCSSRWRSWRCSSSHNFLTFSCTMAIKTFLLLLLLLDPNQLGIVKGQTRNEPVNVNWIFSLPWDVGNTLRAPLGGPVSLALSAFMACILLFGFLLAPVNYILGFPPRIYHTYRIPGLLGRSYNSELMYNSSFPPNYSYYHDNNDNTPESFDMADIIVHLFHRVSSTTRIVFDRDEDYSFGEDYIGTGRELTVLQDNSFKPPGFLDSIFLLVPEEDLACRQLMVCHAHGFLEFFPKSVVKLYKMLSKHFIDIPENYKEAIVVGLVDQALCSQVYTDCTKDLFQLTRGAVSVIRQKLLHFLPQGTKDIWQAFYAHYNGPRRGST